jgi:hypothetical protein
MERPPQSPSQPGSPGRIEEHERKAYEPPSLRVFGSVAAITASIARDTGNMDGGSNKFKT